MDSTRPAPTLTPCPQCGSYAKARYGEHLFCWRCIGPSLGPPPSAMTELVLVSEEEVERALKRHGKRKDTPATRERIRRNIAIGKLAGAYRDWSAA